MSASNENEVYEIPLEELGEVTGGAGDSSNMTMMRGGSPRDGSPRDGSSRGSFPAPPRPHS